MHSLAIVLLCHKKHQNAASTLFHPPIYRLRNGNLPGLGGQDQASILTVQVHMLVGSRLLLRNPQEELPCKGSKWGMFGVPLCWHEKQPNFGHTHVAHLHELLRFGYFLFDVSLILNVAGHCELLRSVNESTFVKLGLPDALRSAAAVATKMNKNLWTENSLNFEEMTNQYFQQFFALSYEKRESNIWTNHLLETICSISDCCRNIFSIRLLNHRISSSNICRVIRTAAPHHRIASPVADECMDGSNHTRNVEKTPIKKNPLQDGPLIVINDGAA